MRNKNTMGRGQYVLDNLYWAALLFFMYMSIFFYPVFGLPQAKSVTVLVCTVIAGVTIGIVLTYKKRRNYISLICNMVFSFGLYFFFSFWRINRRPLLIACCIAAALVICYSFAVFQGYIRARKQKTTQVSVWKCVCGCMLSNRTLVCLVLAVLMVGTGIRSMLGIPVTENTGETVTVDAADSFEEAIAKNMDTVLLLQETRWTKLDATARLRVMKTIADIEANYLGIGQLTVCTQTLEEDTLGLYNDATKTVTLDIDYLAAAQARDVLTVLCHECYHAFQYRLVELYTKLDEGDKALMLFREAARYQEEFANYIKGNEDFDAYKAQWCETDSNDYAEEAIIKYYYWIYRYNENNMAAEETEEYVQ